MKNSKKYLIIFLLIILVLFTSLSVKNNEKEEAYKIGVIYGFTGAASAWSEMGQMAIDLAVQEINENGGINGRVVEVIYENSETNPSKSVLAFNKLTEVDNVDVVVGDVWSFLTNPLIPLAEEKEVVLISPTVMDVSVESDNSYFFTVGHKIESQREAVEKFFEVNSEIKTISALCWDDAWGNANLELLKRVSEDKSVRVLSVSCTSDFGSNYQTEISKIKSVNPDAIYFNSSIPDVVLRKIKDLGLEDKKVLTSSIAIDAIEVNKTPIQYLENVYFTNWQPEQDFVNKFKDKYGVFPIIEAQNHYDLIRSVAFALEEGDDFKNSLKKVKFVGSEGMDIDFSDNNQIQVNEGKAKLFTYDGEYDLVE